MLIVLSPAKSLDFESRPPRVAASQPRLLTQAEQLAAVMRTKSVADLAALAQISDELAVLNAERWASFPPRSPRATPVLPSWRSTATSTRA